MDGSNSRTAPQGKDNILSSMSFGGSAHKKNESTAGEGKASASQFKQQPNPLPRILDNMDSTDALIS